jgi:hypothetical protein
MILPGTRSSVSLLGAFWLIGYVLSAQSLPVPPNAPLFSAVLLFPWSDPTAVWSNAHVVVRGVSTKGAAAWAIAKYIPNRQGSPQWDDAKKWWVIMRDEKEVADVIIEDAPSLHIGAWKCWIGEKSGELEEVPWRSEGGDRLGETTSSAVEGRIQFVLAKLDAITVGIQSPFKVVVQHEQYCGDPIKGNATLSLVSLHGWIRRDGQSRWLSVEKWHNSHRMQVIESFFRQKRSRLKAMWEYADTNTPEVVVNVHDVERGLAAGWINGKLYYFTGGYTETPNPAYVMVDFNEEGCPKEVRLRMGRDTETSWVVDRSKMRSKDVEPVPWRTPGMEERIVPSGFWDRLEEERKAFGDDLLDPSAGRPSGDVKGP